MSSGIEKTTCQTGYTAPPKVTTASDNGQRTSEVISNTISCNAAHVDVKTIVCGVIQSTRTSQVSVQYQGLLTSYSNVHKLVSKL